jgi:hypothetical protein
LLLAAQAFSHLINRAKASGGGADVMRGLMQEILAFCHAPFHEACRPPPGRGKDAEFLGHIDSVLTQAARLLGAALEQHAPVETGVLFEGGYEFLSRVLGLFEFNNIDVEVSSPVFSFFAAKGRALLANRGDPAADRELMLLERLLRHKEWVMKCVWGEETTGIYADDEADHADNDAPMDADAREEDEETEVDEQRMAAKAMAEAQAAVDSMSFDELLSAPWPSFHGTGLFPSVARLNHSCRPNVKVDFPTNSARLRVMSIEPAIAGEQLCICYIRKEEKVEVRRRQLLEYGFTCNCPRCIEEDAIACRKTKKRLK